MSDLLWPVFDGPGDLASIEAVPLADRGLPGTTYDLLARAAALWPDRVALSVLADAARFEHPVQRTFAGLLADVHAYANAFHAHGVRRGDAVALLAPNCAELVTATLAAELAGIAAPVNGSLSQDGPPAATHVRRACPGRRRARARPRRLHHGPGAGRGGRPGCATGPAAHGGRTRT